MMNYHADGHKRRGRSIIIGHRGVMGTKVQVAATVATEEGKLPQECAKIIDDGYHFQRKL